MCKQRFSLAEHRRSVMVAIHPCMCAGGSTRSPMARSCTPSSEAGRLSSCLTAVCSLTLHKRLWLMFLLLPQRMNGILKCLLSRGNRLCSNVLGLSSECCMHEGSWDRCAWFVAGYSDTAKRMQLLPPHCPISCPAPAGRPGKCNATHQTTRCQPEGSCTEQMQHRSGAL